MDWLLSCPSNMAGISAMTACSCFAAGVQTVSRHCTIPGMGYILLYKRLNNGVFQWPRTEQELRLLDARSFRWLMEGLKIDQPKAIQKEKSEETKIILYFPIILARRFFRVNIFLTIQCLIFPQDSLIDKRCLLLDASGHFEHGSVSNRTGRLGKSCKPA